MNNMQNEYKKQIADLKYELDKKSNSYTRFACYSFAP